MKTLGRKSDFRVMVMPRGMGDFGGMSLSTRLLYGNTELEQARLERDEKERCEEIASAIKRHTDNVAWTEIVFEQERLCSHCGATWTETSDTYNGGCCDADEQGHEAATAATAAPPL